MRKLSVRKFLDFLRIASLICFRPLVFRPNRSITYVDACSLDVTLHYYKVIRGVAASDHIVAQQANRYIVTFHIAISYDTQRPPYNGQAVGLPPTHCMYGLI